MAQICRCGQPATHRLRWNPWLEVTEPVISRRPAYCRHCARTEGEAKTRERRAVLDRERDFHGAERHVFRTPAPVPATWGKLARAAALRHQDVINPGGLVETYRRNGHLIVELCPPKEKPESWSPENCLYLIRYLTRRPFVFQSVPRDESPSPSTWRESRERWSATVSEPVRLAQPSTPSSDGGAPSSTE